MNQQETKKEVTVVEANVAKTWINALTGNSERYILKTGRKEILTICDSS